MNTDLTFITNEPDASLLNRFKILIKDARFFDSLVGYFYTSGFYKLYPLLEKTEKTHRARTNQFHPPLTKVLDGEALVAPDVHGELVASDDLLSLQVGFRSLQFFPLICRFHLSLP